MSNESATSNKGLDVEIEGGMDKAMTSSPNESRGSPRILRGVTHDPRFSFLQSFSQRAQEKLIAGWDQIFEETVDQIHSLTADTFWTNIDELWKTLEELERMGYNVVKLRKRLDELTEVMKKRKSSQVEISKLRIKAEEYNKEKKKIEKEMSMLQFQVDKTQVKVDELMDQVSKMESNLPAVDVLFGSLAINPL